MERLTAKRADGRWAIANKDNATPLEQMNKIQKVVERLAAYEDTGLEPEIILELLADATAMQECIAVMGRQHILDALREKQERMNPLPLTLDELKQMGDKPIYIYRLEDGMGWWAVIRSVNHLKLSADYDGWFSMADYGKTWIAYRHKPEEVQKGDDHDI